MFPCLASSSLCCREPPREYKPPGCFISEPSGKPQYEMDRHPPFPAFFQARVHHHGGCDASPENHPQIFFREPRHFLDKILQYNTLFNAGKNMTKKFISIAGAIKFLGVSRPTVYRFIEAGMPNYKVGGRHFFDPDELTEWIKSHRDGQVKKRVKPKKNEP